MKKAGSLLVVLVAAVASILAVECGIRHFYKRFGYHKYTDSFEDVPSYPWE